MNREATWVGCAAAAAAVARLHGGRSWAERVPAGGTAFRFTLPLDEVPAVPAEPAVD